MTIDDVRLALRDCYDPTLPCNILDLGLVHAITVEPDLQAPGLGIPGVPQKHRVTVTLTATSPTEDAEAQLTAQVANRLAGFEGVSRTNVIFEHTPPWTPARITPEGRKILGLDGNPALVQIR